MACFALDDGHPRDQVRGVGDDHVAYQVVGDCRARPPVRAVRDDADRPDVGRAGVRRGLHQLASFSRLITCDLMGVGSSDAVAVEDMPAMQSWTDGMLAVLDEVDSGCAGDLRNDGVGAPDDAVRGEPPDPGPRAGALEPVRVVRAQRRPAVRDARGDAARRTWRGSLRRRHHGAGNTADLLAPSRAGDPAFRRWWARGERLSGGPAISPTSWSCSCAATPGRRSRASRRRRSSSAGRATGTSVTGMRRRSSTRSRTRDSSSSTGDDNVWFAGDVDEVIDHIESFLTGKRSPTSTSRVLSTVLFTDIVGLDPTRRRRPVTRPGGRRSRRTTR